MSADRFQRVMEAFEAASALPTHLRDAFLADFFPDDADARSEVEGLLGHHDNTSHAVATAAGLDAAGLLMDDAHQSARQSPLPALRGEYRIVRTIGEGGMGIVFEAEQAFPRRRVAVKALRPGFASASMLRRFRNEAEFLAKLQHPNIAQIFEAGVAGPDAPDQPYFVMELVQGEALTAYARTHALGIPEKWRLLLQVCDAVQHAHQRGVIHRDLKPANILVNSNGIVKVLDFGIARAAEVDLQQSHATREGQLIGTPSYMSPEQLLEGDASTASDIYALGVIAYELLTQRLPLDLSAVPIARVATVIASTPIAPASSFERQLRGDGETIIAKALATDPKRRYASAEELAEDIRHMLAGEAILARGDSAVYVFAKQVKRYRAIAALVSLALVSLIAFAIISQFNASAQRRLAQLADASRAEAVAQRESALAATAIAESNRQLARQAEQAARSELSQANIERGRMAATTSNLSLAEDILWREYLSSPTNPSAFWAIWEMYNAVGSNWATKPTRQVMAAATSLDQSTIALVGDGAVRLLDPATGEFTTTINNLPSAPLGAVALWPDASRVAVALQRGDIAIVPLDVDAERLTLAGLATKPPIVRAIVISPDGSTLAAACADKTVRVWSTHSGELLQTFALAWTAGVIDLSGDGSKLAVALLQPEAYVFPPRSIAIYSVRDGTMLHDLSHLERASHSGVKFSPDDSFVYIDHVDSILIAWHLDQQRELFRFSKLRSRASCYLLSPDGTKLLVGGYERSFILDAYTGEQLMALAVERYGLSTACWRPDSTITLATSDGVIRNINTNTDAGTHRITGHTSWCFAVNFSPDDNLIVLTTGGSIIEVRETATYSQISQLRLPGPSTRTRGVHFLRDGQTVLAGSADGMVRVIDALSGDLRRQFPSINAEIYGFDVNPQETLVATGHWNRRAAILDLATGENLCELPLGEKRVDGLAFSPDGDLLALSNNNLSITLWDVPTKQIVVLLPTTAMPWGVVFSPDGHTLYASTYAGTIEVFDVQTRQRTHVTQGHSRLIPGLALSHDGTILASGAEDGILRLWDAPSLKPLTSFTPSASVVVSVAFSSNTDRIAAGVANRETVVYDLPTNARLVEAHRNRFVNTKR